MKKVPSGIPKDDRGLQLLIFCPLPGIKSLVFFLTLSFIYIRGDGSGGSIGGGGLAPIRKNYVPVGEFLTNFVLCSEGYHQFCYIHPCQGT